MSDILLKNFDPSLLQNVILVVVAIFIPFFIALLEGILDLEKKESSKFEKTVLIEEVMEPRKFFLLSIIGIFFFTLFEGKDINNTAKILALLMAAGLTYLFWLSFKKILDFSEGNESGKSKFFISFFEKLKDKKDDKQIEYWDYFWSKKTKFKEKEFTEIFISHIDYAIKHEKFYLAQQLAGTYVKYIEKRNWYLVGYNILPKVLEWSKSLSLWLDSVPRVYPWFYFEKTFFQAIIKMSLKYDNSNYVHGTRILFREFEKHIKKIKKILDDTENDKEKDKYWIYIVKLFESFYPTFFNEKINVQFNYYIWEYNFPWEWGIKTTNKDLRLPLLILKNFLSWLKDRIFLDNKEDRNKSSNIITGLFPNVDSCLFKSFLRLLFSFKIKNGIKYVLEKELNIDISARVDPPPFYPIGKDIDVREIITEEKKKEKSQKEETIQIILKYLLSVKDISKKLIDSNSKQSIEKRELEERLEKMKKEIESDKIKEICKNSEEKKGRKEDFLELVNLLLEKIKVDEKSS